MPEFIKVAKASDLPPGAGKTMDVGGKRIALFNDGGAYRAVADTCLHRGGPLGEGSLEAGIVTCPWHHWRYDTKTGECVDRPGMRVAAYPVKVEGGDVFVEV